MTDLSQSRAAFVDEVGTAAADGPVVAHVTATMPDVTPLAAYAALAGRSDYGFLLESAEKTPSSDPAGAFAPDHATADRHARFSFVGYDPDAVVRVGPGGTELERLDGRAAAYVETPETDTGEGCDSAADPDVLDRLRAAFPDLPRVGFPDDDRQQLRGGLVGFLAYEAVYDLWLSEVGVDRPDTDTPDAEFVLTTKTISIDHADGSVSLVLTPVVAPDDDPGAVYDDLREPQVVHRLVRQKPDQPAPELLAVVLGEPHAR